MRAVTGIVLALIAAGALFAATAGDDVRLGVAGEPTSAKQSVYEIRPGEGIGPVQIGMSRAEAARAMRRTGHAVGTIRRWPAGSPPILAMQLNTFQVYFDGGDRVEEIEVMGPTSDWQHMGAGAEFSARYGGVDVFRTPAKRLVELISRDAKADPVATEWGGTLTFPTLGISLWRMAVDNTPRFESVLVTSARRASDRRPARAGS